MTKREKQIADEIKYNRKYVNGLGAFAEVFKQGVKWADENPDEYTFKMCEITKLAIQIRNYEKLLGNSKDKDTENEIKLLKNKLDLLLNDIKEQLMYNPKKHILDCEKHD